MARWISSIRRVGFAAERSIGGEHGDLQVLPHVIPEDWHADVVGLQGSDPQHFLDAVLQVSLVGGGGRTLLQQQLLGHPPVHAGIRRQGQGIDDDGGGAAVVGGGDMTVLLLVLISLRPPFDDGGLRSDLADLCPISP